jgi:hypothetical protein
LIEAGSPDGANDQSDSVVDDCFMALPEATAASKEAPGTLKLSKFIQDVEVLILIDSRSSHIFISEQVTVSLLGVSPLMQPTSVKVANGQVVKSCSEML